MFSALFEKNLRRLDLLSLPEKNDVQIIKIAVYRNHSFEITAGVLNAFLGFSGIKAEFVYSDYDDSLNFKFQDADLQLIWIDTLRYKTADLASFLTERADTLRAQTRAPVLISYLGIPINFSGLTTDCYAFSMSDAVSYLGDSAYDVEKEPFSGTRLSNSACLESARILGLVYIPAILKIPLKAIVVDMDNTLYSGILGEDGIDGVVPNNNLQKQLKNLKEKGFFLCIASKNEENDARLLFEKRNDFVLRWSDFTFSEINWNSKADNLLKIAAKLNISTDAILFIDDNPAEIENVSHTGIETILADSDVCQILKYYPRLMKLRTSSEDNLRSLDIQANEKRAKLAKVLTREEYFKKLGIKLTYNINNEEYIPRVAELLGKTNQFILTYKRYKETVVQSFMRDDDKCLITIRMEDNLSDSGVIAILAAHREGDHLKLDELTVSCRALGRNLENIMLPYLFKVAKDKLQTKGEISIPYKKGERNVPALRWLAELSGKEIMDSGELIYSIPETIDLTGLDVKVYS